MQRLDFTRSPSRDRMMLKDLDLNLLVLFERTRRVGSRLFRSICNQSTCCIELFYRADSAHDL